MSLSRNIDEAVMIVNGLEDLIQKLHKIFESDEVNVEEVHSVMKSYKSNPAEWIKYAKFDRYRYTRNLVDAGNGKFNLMILCWNENQGSAIHDHADAHCFMKMLHGSLTEIRFAWPETTEWEEKEGGQRMQQGDPSMKNESELQEEGRSRMDLNDVCYINDSIGLHRVENFSHTEKAVSLHLYCPPYSSCSVFDQRTGRKSKCNVTFWSKFGQRMGNGCESEELVLKV